MPFSFVCLGVCFIFLMFFMDYKKRGNILVVAGILTLLVGFFVGEIELKTCSINILNVIGVLVIFVGILCLNSRFNWVRVVSLPFVTGLFYYVLNVIDVDMNMFFNLVPSLLVVCVVSLVCFNNPKESILVVLLSGFVLEIINYFFILEDVGYLALFSHDFIVCIVLCGGFVLLTKTTRKLVENIRKMLAIKKQN